MMDLTPLLKLLADGEFHSGEGLGRALGISRTAIWKQIGGLRNLGIDIHSVTGKGYRIQEPLSLLDRDEILAALTGAEGFPGDCLDIHLSTGSSNAEAMAKVRQGVSRYLVLAEHQRQGRGRRGRQWVSPAGRNLYFSLLWSFENGVGALEGLSLVAGLALLRALDRAGFHGAGVKWPNDVLRDGGKLAGILLEMQGDMTGPCQVVTGIGLNINMPDEAGSQIDQPYVSLMESGGKPVNRSRIAGILLDELLAAYRVFEERGFAPFVEEWQARDVYLGKAVEIRSGKQVILGVNRGVSDTGALLLQTDDGVRTIHGGEVFPSLRPVGEEDKRENRGEMES